MAPYPATLDLLTKPGVEGSLDNSFRNRVHRLPLIADDLHPEDLRVNIFTYATFSRTMDTIA
jgi:hypothetical protein